MSRSLSHTDELARDILIAIAPTYVHAHAAHCANVFYQLEELKAKEKGDEKDVMYERLKRATKEASLLHMGTGCVAMARQIAHEWELSGGAVDTALRKGRDEAEKLKLVEEPDRITVELGDARI